MKIISVATQIILVVLLLAGCAAPGAVGKRVEKTRESFVSGGRRISVETFAPPGAGRFPSVLVLHSAAGTLVGKGELENFSRSLAEQGQIAFLVRYFDRTGTIFAGDGAISEHREVWIETIRHAVDFAEAHPRVDPGFIGIFGFSLGAYLAVAQSSLDPRVDAVVSLGGGIFDGGFENRMRRLPPVLILHGLEDQRVPVSEAYEVQRAGRQFGAATRLKIYDGEGHRLSPAASADASSRALQFLAEQRRQSGAE